METMLSDPHWWSNAYQQLPSVAPESHLHPAMLDFYLMQEWYTTAQNTPSTNYVAFYLDRRTISKLIPGTLPYTIWRQLLFSKQEEAIKHPVLFIQGGDDGP